LYCLPHASSTSIRNVHGIATRLRSLPYRSRSCERTTQLHQLRSRQGAALALREDLEVVDQIVEVGGAEAGPARHLFMERIARRVDAGDDGGLDRLPVEGGMAAGPERVLVPLGVRQSPVGH